MSTEAKSRDVEVAGLRTHYLEAGSGQPLVLIHGDGENSFDSSWVVPALARTHRVYAPDLPGFGDSAKPGSEYSPAFFAHFLAEFLDVIGVDRAVVVGNSLGGLVALRLALDQPARLAALGLVDSAGLGREINPVLLPQALPGVGEVGIAWARTPLGAVQRAWWRATLLFAQPSRVPLAWIAEQRRLAQVPGFAEATLAALRAVVDLRGQRIVLLDELPQLSMPTLVIWGAGDRVFPRRHARAALERLRRGRLAIIPGAGHLPQVEAPDRFVAALSPFLAEMPRRGFDR